MAASWEARLDCNFRHVTEPEKPVLAGRFVGPVRDMGNHVEGDSVVVWDTTDTTCELKVEVGKTYFLTGSERGDSAEIARIELLCAKAAEGEEIFADVTWWWRSRHLEQDGVEAEVHPPPAANELFLQSCQEETEQPIQAVELCALQPTVHELEFMPSAAEVAEMATHPATFFSCRTYDKDMNEVSALKVGCAITPCHHMQHHKSHAASQIQ